jgi:hypothetical protein
MGEPIEDLYFNWLYAKVAYRRPSTPSTRYQSLLYFLHCTEFVWLVSGDDNRAEEGRELRREFLQESSIQLEESWMLLDCSVLEMLIAFSRRAEFNTDISAERWFWIMIDHLGLSDISDSTYSEQETADVLGPALENFIWRLYDRNGRGGLFPLRHPLEDQRKVEIWYQFCEYLVEQGLV